MKVVVDANLIFSALVLKASRIREAFFRETNTFYCPVFVFTELFKKDILYVALAIELIADL